MNLTKQQILEHPAGRELDGLIAKMLGWKWRNSISRWVEPGGAYAHQHPPAYANDMNCAWRIIEHFSKTHPGWRFSLLGGDAAFQGFKAEWFGHLDPEQDYGQRHGSAKAETPMLAICRASLLTTITHG